MRMYVCIYACIYMYIISYASVTVYFAGEIGKYILSLSSHLITERKNKLDDHLGNLYNMHDKQLPIIYVYLCMYETNTLMSVRVYILMHCGLTLNTESKLPLLL